MIRAWLRGVWVLPVAAALLCVAAGDPPPGDSRALVVTTDSSDYCHTLSNAIDAQRPLPREVVELKLQGDGMCGQGQIRGGITRLRRALLALHHQRGPERP